LWEERSPTPQQVDVLQQVIDAGGCCFRLSGPVWGRSCGCPKQQIACVKAWTIHYLGRARSLSVGAIIVLVVIIALGSAFGSF
jgi:hypothetical protein